MKKEASLMSDIAGLKLDNPIILASGILGYSADTLREAAHAGAGAVLTKSLGLKPRQGYKNPTIAQVECGIINAMGLPNPGIYSFAPEIKNLHNLEIPLIVSIYGYSPQEYVEAAKIAIQAGAKAIELNLSCPHIEKTGAEIGQNPEMIKEVIKEVKKEIKKPVFAKLTPNIDDIVKLAKASSEAGIDAVTAINTLKAMKIDIETTHPVLANKVGGLSGPAIKPIAVRCVYEIFKNTELPIIGCGGISTWQDAVEFILAGASVIQMGTIIAFKDLAVFAGIKQGLKNYLNRKGYRSIKEIVGLAHRF